MGSRNSAMLMRRFFFDYLFGYYKWPFVSATAFFFFFLFPSHRPRGVYFLHCLFQKKSFECLKFSKSFLFSSPSPSSTLLCVNRTDNRVFTLSLGHTALALIPYDRVNDWEGVGVNMKRGRQCIGCLTVVV